MINLTNLVLKNPRLKLHTIILCLILLPLLALSQQNQLDTGKKYNIGEITVTGSQSFNELTVIAFSGLKKGEEIFIPGERISNVIKKLWDENLFSDVNIYVTSIEGNTANLEVNITELPTLNQATITGIRKGRSKELQKELNLTSGTKITKNLLTTTKNYITNKYKKDGFYFANVFLKNTPEIDSTGTEVGQNLSVNIDRGNKVKISKIHIEGNDALSDKKLRRAMKKTKQINPLRLFKRSKYAKDAFQEDHVSLINKYK